MQWKENGRAGGQDQLENVATEGLTGRGPGPGHCGDYGSREEQNSEVGPEESGGWCAVSLGHGSVRVLWTQELDMRNLPQMPGICVIWVFSDTQQ